MAMSLGLVIHVAGGAVGLVSGAAALMTRKGALRHRQAGALFVVSMTIMAVTGVELAWGREVFITVLAGLVSLYLLLSSWLTVRRKEKGFGPFDLASMVFGIAVTALGIGLSWRAFNGQTDNLGTFIVPAMIYYTFTAMALTGVVADLSVLLRRGVSGRQRILRHLWRMCVPLYIAASSFFTGQQQVFPESLQGTVYLTIPENIVLLAMLFWIAKTIFDRRKQTPVRL